jgi:hypothetical protein
MGTWGSEVYENDHALDLFSEEAQRLADQLEEALGLKDAAFDDIEGPLVYVRMLWLLAQDSKVQGIDRAKVEAWKKTYLEIFDTTIEAPEGRYATRRREIIHREFDGLASRLSR